MKLYSICYVQLREIKTMSNTAFEEEFNANGRNSKQEIVQKLEAFCKYNPTAKVESKEDATYILNPWGDSSLAFRLKEDNDLLFEALNNILLPPELTALSISP